MQRPRFLVLSLAYFAVAASIAQAADKTDDPDFNVIQRLTNTLFRNYDSDVRPVADYRRPVNTSVGLSLIEADIDEISSTMIVEGWMRVKWVDERLVWNPADFDDLSLLRIPIEKLWRPDIVLYNSASASDIDTYGKTNAIVYSNGGILWVPPVSLVARCALDLRSWPRDTQTCTLIIGSWTRSEKEVMLQRYNGEAELDITDYTNLNSQWQITGTKLSIVNKKYDCCEEKYPAAHMQITMKRQSPIYTATLCIPAIVIVALTVSSFLIPSNRGAKLAFGLVNVLILVGYMFYFASQLPPMGENLPAVVTFFQYTLVLVAISLVASALFMWWTTSPSVSGPPQIVMKIVTGPLGSLLGLRSLITMASSNRSSILQRFEREGSNLVADNEKGRQSLESDFVPTTKDNSEEAQLQWLLLACASDRILMLVYSIVLGTLMANSF